MNLHHCIKVSKEITASTHTHTHTHTHTLTQVTFQGMGGEKYTGV